MDCEQNKCRMAREHAARRGFSPELASWFIRAAHERYCEGIASAIVVEICPDCNGVVAGSAAGPKAVPALRGANGQFLPGSRVRYRDCACGTWVDHNVLAERHGIALAVERGIDGSTGRSVD